jgi:hypothetical protein
MRHDEILKMLNIFFKERVPNKKEMKSEMNLKNLELICTHIYIYTIIIYRYIS